MERNEIKTFDLDALEFVSRHNAHIAISMSLIFITLIFSLASLAAVCYRLDAIKSTLGL